jgi:hypothetical protein
MDWFHKTLKYPREVVLDVPQKGVGVGDYCSIKRLRKYPVYTVPVDVRATINQPEASIALRIFSHLLKISKFVIREEVDDTMY